MTEAATLERPAPAAAAPVDDPVIWRIELAKRLGPNGVTSETMRKYIRDGVLPKPDITLNLRMQGWQRSTLLRHGLNPSLLGV